MVSLKKHFWLWWFRSGIGLRIGLFAFFSLVLIYLLYTDHSNFKAGFINGNVAVFSLINLNIAILCILILLIARNVIKLLFDRKSNVLGSKLRFRLVTAFVGLTAVPVVLLVIVASGLLSKALDGWFSSPAEASVEAATEVGKIHFRLLKDQTLNLARKLSIDLQTRQFSLSSPEALRDFFEKQRVQEGLFALEMYDQNLQPIVAVHNAAAHINHFAVPTINPAYFQRAISGDSTVRVTETSYSEFIRAYASLVWNGKTVVLIATHRVDSELSEALANIRESYNEYLQLQRFKNPLRSNYILTLYILAGLVLFSAMWFGIFIARQLTGPIQQLAAAMREVARGNYKVQLPQTGDDEIGFLTRTYNQMASELHESVSQAERRQVYLETVLTNLAVGVIVVDPDGRIISVNRAARKVLSDEERKAAFAQGKLLEEYLPEPLKKEVVLLQESVTEANTISNIGSREKQIECVLQGRERKLLCTAGLLRTGQGEELGTVLLIDDVTALSEAQRLAAWREAARRIAHEIKNPLTPIRLAAQRLQSAFADNHDFSKLVEEASSTIVEHVDSIKRLADEFSRFARMPSAQFATVNLNSIIEEIVSSYAENQSDIAFQCITDDKLVSISADGEQIRRLLINLLENSVKALVSEFQRETIKADRERPKIIARTWFDSHKDKAYLEISDNGPGIPLEDRPRVFEPYFSRTVDGTGLGLAIVAAIMSEHGGEVRLEENIPKGTRVTASFPAHKEEVTIRKFDVAVS